MKVYQAINAVQSDLARVGIEKSRRNTQQGYSFRGIDDVYGALAPLLAKHGLCILPRVTYREVTEHKTAKGGTLFFTVLTVDFDFVAVEDGSKHTVTTIGEAMDSADKSSTCCRSLRASANISAATCRWCATGAMASMSHPATSSCSRTAA